MLNNPEVYVVGNGPSLKKDLIKALAGRNWLGMNSAYRYWRKVNIFPKYYACLDPVVIQSHAVEIKQLITEGVIDKFLLHQEFRAIYPDLVSANLMYLDDFLNVSQIVPFSSLSVHKQTTGVLALRFVIEMGYEKIVLLGIDCSYVEEVEGSKAVQGYELQIDHQHKNNPNYFFDEYQTQGDRYQVPNPAVHSGNLHLQSFIAFKNDLALSIKSQKIDIKIGTKKSLLYQYSVFSGTDIYQMLGMRKLSCIMMVIGEDELDKTLKLINLWSEPKLVPSLFQHKMKVETLKIFLMLDSDSNIKNTIYRTLNKQSKIFNKIEIYFKGKQKLAKNEYQNFMLSCLENCIGNDYTLSLSANSVPIKAGWLDRVEQILSEQDESNLIVSLKETKDKATMFCHKDDIAIYNTGTLDLLCKAILNPISQATKIDNRNDNFVVSHDSVITSGFKWVNAQFPDAWLSILDILDVRYHTFLKNSPSYFSGTSACTELALLGASSDTQYLSINHHGFGVITVDKIKDYNKAIFIVHFSAANTPDAVVEDSFIVAINIAANSSVQQLINSISIHGNTPSNRSIKLASQLSVDKDGSLTSETLIRPFEFSIFSLIVNLSDEARAGLSFTISAKCYKTLSETVTDIVVYENSNSKL